MIVQDQPDQSEVYKEAFYIREGERAPSEIQAESLPYVTRQAMTVEDQKTETYQDLKYYFKEHKWIAIMFDYEGYYSQKILTDFDAINEQTFKKYADEILTSLPNGTYRNVVRLTMTSSINMDITMGALEGLYNNKNITSLYIDRELSSHSHNNSASLTL